jgi:hypothetical protein
MRFRYYDFEMIDDQQESYFLQPFDDFVMFLFKLGLDEKRWERL